jgi:isochorismate synthase
VTPADPLPELHGVRVALAGGASIDPFSLARTGARLLRSDRLTLVGLGTAAVLPLPNGLDDPGTLDHVVDALASVDCEDGLGRVDRDALPAPVLAFGALPFERSEGAVLVVPQLTVGRTEDGPVWCTVLASNRRARPHPEAELAAWLSGSGTPGSEPGRDPGRNEAAVVGARTTDDHFERLVAEAIAAIRRDELAKVVLARQVDVAMADPVDVAALLRRWSRLEPACTVFSVPVADGQFVGASPELLVERSVDRVRSRPLAGTAGRRLDEAAAESEHLLDSRKDLEEHRFVVEAIARALGQYCRHVDAPSRPEVVPLRSMTHLGTEITGQLDRRPDGSFPHVLELVGALHPTPAVGGVPTEAARATIDRLEPEGRGAYAGPVGFVDAAGDGRWVVGIRSMTVRGREARLVAGVGIVEGSEPRTERMETDLKLRAVLDALAPEADLPVIASGGRATIR